MSDLNVYDLDQGLGLLVFYLYFFGLFRTYGLELMDVTFLSTFDLLCISSLSLSSYKVA